VADTIAAGITHLVLLEVRPNVDSLELDRVLSAVLRLGELPGVRRLRVGPDISREGLQGNFTHAIVVDFDGEASRDSYVNSPEHLAVADMLGPCIDRIVVVDL
jgi:hypothetical protein